MIPVIGQLLPLALGIALSPIPITATIVLVLSTRGLAASVGFLAGWGLGILVPITLWTLLSSVLPSSLPDVARPGLGTVEILLGITLIVLGSRRVRPAARNPDAAPPAWLDRIDALGPGRSLALGFVYSAFRAKNLILIIASSLVIGSAALAPVPGAIVIVVFTALAASSIAAPVAVYAFGGTRTRDALDRTRDWLTRNLGVVAATAMIVLGVVVIGMGLGQF